MTRYNYAVRKVPPEVFTGTDPGWKEAWEEMLTSQERRDVNSAVLRGRRVNDPSLAPFVYGKVALARRSLRLTLIFTAPIQIALFGVWAWIDLSHEGGSPWWAWLLAGTAFSALWVVAIRIRVMRLRRAEEENTWGPAAHRDVTHSD